MKNKQKKLQNNSASTIMEVLDQPIEVIVYETLAGEQPFNEWLNLLDKSVRGRVDARIDRLAHGNRGHVKSLKDGMAELKLKVGPGYRVYFAEIGRQVVLLISGGDKSSQSDDIKRAKEYLKDYRGRYGSKKSKF